MDPMALNDDTLMLGEETDSSDSELVGWVMSRVQRWRNKRDEQFLGKWRDYYSIWRGEWTGRLKNKDVERSRLISPATQQAVDSFVAEMVEATFGRSTWFDLSDDTPELPQTVFARDNLLKDFDRDRVPSTIREAYLTGAIYGTGIAKRIVEEKTLPNASPTDPMADAAVDSYVSVYWEAIPPFNFVIDTAAKTVEEALGCAHETLRPRHEIEAAQRSGDFLNVQIGDMTGYVTSAVGRGPRNDTLEVDPADGVYITEYHGLVPRRLIEPEMAPETTMDGLEEEEESSPAPGEDMIEAIVTIGNGGTLLKKVRNPFNDRGIVAYAHDKVPNTFWGRGICEKAYNSQLALDSELRARIDALGLMTYPVMGADASRLPRNLNLKLQPGKVIMTNGQPSEIIQPITFGNLQPTSFHQTGDLERYVSMATGSYEAATPQNINSRNETASGVSMAVGSMVKRAKMTMQNVDQDFLDPLIRKTLIAYSQLDEERYPVKLKFRVNSTMSIMAREFEQAQMTNLLAIMPQETPAFLLVLRAIVENYSGPSKDKLVQQIDAMMEPDPKQQQMQEMMQQLQMMQAQGEVQKLQAEVKKLTAEAEAAIARAKKELIMATVADEKLEIDAANVVLEARQTKVQEQQVQLKEKELGIRAKEASRPKTN